MTPMQTSPFIEDSEPGISSAECESFSQPRLLFPLLITLLAIRSSCGCLRATTEQQMERIDSSSGVEATKAFDSLFFRGREALPYVRDLMKEEALFNGWCGSAILQSQASVSAMEPEAPQTTIQEAAVYLFQAILNGDLYFSNSCRLVLDGQQKGDAEQKKLRIAQLFTLLDRISEDELVTMGPEEFQRLLQDHGITFAGTR